MDDKRKSNFETADLPVIAHAFMCERGAMRDSPAAQRRAAGILATVEQIIPAGAKEFSAEDWCEIAFSIGTAKTFAVGFERHGWSSDNGYVGRITVRVDRRSWSSRDAAIPRNDGRLDAVVGLMTELAPAGAERFEIPDSDFGGRRPTTVPTDDAEPRQGMLYN